MIHTPVKVTPTPRRPATLRRRRNRPSTTSNDHPSDAVITDYFSTVSSRVPPLHMGPDAGVIVVDIDDDDDIKLINNTPIKNNARNSVTNNRNINNNSLEILNNSDIEVIQDIDTNDHSLQPRKRLKIDNGNNVPSRHLLYQNFIHQNLCSKVNEQIINTETDDDIQVVSECKTVSSKAKSRVSGNNDIIDVDDCIISEPSSLIAQYNKNNLQSDRRAVSRPPDASDQQPVSQTLRQKALMEKEVKREHLKVVNPEEDDDDCCIMTVLPAVTMAPAAIKTERRVEASFKSTNMLEDVIDARHKAITACQDSKGSSSIANDSSDEKMTFQLAVINRSSGSNGPPRDEAMKQTVFAQPNNYLQNNKMISVTEPVLSEPIITSKESARNNIENSSSQNGTLSHIETNVKETKNTALKELPLDKLQKENISNSNEIVISHQPMNKVENAANGKIPQLATLHIIGRFLETQRKSSVIFSCNLDRSLKDLHISAELSESSREQTKHETGLYWSSVRSTGLLGIDVSKLNSLSVIGSSVNEGWCSHTTISATGNCVNCNVYVTPKTTADLSNTDTSTRSEAVVGRGTMVDENDVDVVINSLMWLRLGITAIHYPDAELLGDMLARYVIKVSQSVVSKAFFPSHHVSRK